MIAALRNTSRRTRQMVRDNETMVQTYCMVILAVFALGFMLIELKSTLLPLSFALFLSLLYMPVVDALTCRSQPACKRRNMACRTAVKRKLSVIGDDGEIAPNCWNGSVSFMVDLFGIGRLPKPVAVLFSVLSALFMLGLAGYIFYDAVDEMYERKDEYNQRFNELLGEFVAWAKTRGVELKVSEIRQELDDLLLNKVAVSAAEGVADFVSQALLSMVFLVFILFARSSDLPKQKLDVLNNPWHAVKYKAQEKVKTYIVLKTLISLATGLISGFMLALLGAPLPTVFGLTTFLLNYVPSIGSWIATLLPLPVILFDPNQTVSTALLAILLPGAVQVIIGDFIEPSFLGRLCKVDPIIVLLSLMLFGYLWGIAGMVLAMPITIVIKLVCRQIPHAIPRYIAGVIYGDLTKYKRQLDQQLRQLKSSANLRNLHPYRTDDDSDSDAGATDAQLSQMILADRDEDDPRKLAESLTLEAVNLGLESYMSSEPEEKGTPARRPRRRRAHGPGMRTSRSGASLAAISLGSPPAVGAGVEMADFAYGPRTPVPTARPNVKLPPGPPVVAHVSSGQVGSPISEWPEDVSTSDRSNNDTRVRFDSTAVCISDKD